MSVSSCTHHGTTTKIGYNHARHLGVYSIATVPPEKEEKKTWVTVNNLNTYIVSQTS